MTITITRGATTMRPALVLDGYESTRALTTQVHDVIGQASPDITFSKAQLRAGRLRYVFLTQAQAVACEVQHTQPGVFTLIDDKVTSARMDYVPHDEIVTRLDPSTGRWIVTVQYREVVV